MGEGSGGRAGGWWAGVARLTVVGLVRRRRLQWRRKGVGGGGVVWCHAIAITRFVMAHGQRSYLIFSPDFLDLAVDDHRTSRRWPGVAHSAAARRIMANGVGMQNPTAMLGS